MDLKSTEFILVFALSYTNLAIFKYFKGNVNEIRQSKITGFLSKEMIMDQLLYLWVCFLIVYKYVLVFICHF